MLSNKEIVCPNNLLNFAHKKKGIKAGIVNAGKPLPMLSVQDAVNENLIEPIFIGDEKEILKCAEDLKWDISNYEIINEPVENNTAAIAAKLASEKKIRILRFFLEAGHFNFTLIGFAFLVDILFKNNFFHSDHSIHNKNSDSLL